MDDLGGPVFFGNITYRIHFATSSLNLKIHQPFLLHPGPNNLPPFTWGKKDHPPFSNIQSPPFSAPLAGNSRQAPDLENNKKNSSHGIYVLVGRFWGWMVISHLKSHRNPGIQQKSMVKVYKHPPKIHGFRKENGMEISPIWKFLFHFRVVFHFSTEPWWEKE